LTRNSVRRAADNLHKSNSNKHATNKDPSPLRRTSARRCPHLDRSVIPEHRIVIIGDLHGMAHKAKCLWRAMTEILGREQLLSALVVFLGDYCDRGLYTKEVITWLVSIQEDRDRCDARTVFLLGNHEFCLLGFLGLLPRPDGAPDFCFRETWDRNDGMLGKHERERWWGADAEEENRDDIHLQGLRWAGSYYERSYGSAATFSSYGADKGDRSALLRNIPDSHIEFLQSCKWVHIEDHPLLEKCVFVHAGLAADGTQDCQQQLDLLINRDSRHPQPEPLFGRDGVCYCPPQLARQGVTVISGHHGKVVLKNHRIILDSCCGDEKKPLDGLILPEALLVHHDGNYETKDAAAIFAGMPKSPGLISNSTSISGRNSQREWSNTVQVMPVGDFSPLDQDYLST